MFDVKNLLYIKNYEFEDRTGGVRNKYLIVLHKSDIDTIITPFTTSQDYVPDHYKNKRCIKDDPACIHSFHYPQGHVIGINGFSFAVPTFITILSNTFQKRSISYWTEKYVKRGAVSHKDTLNDQEYYALVECIHESRFAPRGVKAALESILRNKG